MQGYLNQNTRYSELTSGDISGGIRTIQLTFTFPSWASSVKIYRNISDSWDAGDLFLESATSSPYDDDGDHAPSAGVPVTFEVDVDWPSSLTGPVNVDESSSFVENAPPGREGGIVQYLESPSDRLVLTGELKGSTSKLELDKLRTFRNHGNPVRIFLTAYTVIWINNDYFITRISWSLRVGKNQNVGAAQVVYVLELIEYVT